jgi:hypothetical protein
MPEAIYNTRRAERGNKYLLDNRLMKRGMSK